MRDHQAERLVERAVRIALGQQSQMRGKRLQAVHGGGAVEEPGGIELDGFGLEGAEMLVEPRAPKKLDAVSGLQHGLLLARAPTPDEAEMAPVRARHDFQDGAGLAMLPGAENDSLVSPFHGQSLSRVRRRNQGGGGLREKSRHGIAPAQGLASGRR